LTREKYARDTRCALIRETYGWYLCSTQQQLNSILSLAVVAVIAVLIVKRDVSANAWQECAVEEAHRQNLGSSSFFGRLMPSTDAPLALSAWMRGKSDLRPTMVGPGADVQPLPPGDNAL
jgi:hypothetical protein